jgi:hypothetical protein
MGKTRNQKGTPIAPIADDLFKISEISIYLRPNFSSEWAMG